MKYLFIFLPIFCFGQDTIVRGLDTVIIGRPHYDGLFFYREWTRIGKHKDFIKGRDSTLYGVRYDSMFVTGGRFYVSGWGPSGIYLADPKPKVVESFKYLGAYYELRENGWYKEILPDTLPKWHRPGEKEYTPNRIPYIDTLPMETHWLKCEDHIGVREMPKRDKIDRTKARILVWNGCNMIELEAYKITHYNEMTVAKDVGNLLIYIPETIKVDIVTEYLYDGGWIKPSHVIKEL